MPGAKINNPSNNTATNAKKTCELANGCSGGKGKMVRSHRNITTTKRISTIISPTP
jgi:hypothetical protein